MSENTYAAAGVNIEEGDRAVELITPHAKRATRPEVMGGLGGFAGLFKLGDYKEPVLAAGSDGVGTKLAVAQAMDKHDTIGIDLVAMCVDDLVVCGAEPLFLQDYIAVGEVVPEKVAEIVKGIAEGCVQAGAALLGGETAEHPGVMGKDEYDVSATAVGVVEADELLGPDKVRDGDVLIAMKSSGLHSNGYSLARYVLLEQAGLPLDGYMEDLGRTLGEELLEPTRIYAKDCLALVSECAVSTFCHVTGGGLAGNLERVIPEGLTAEVSRSTWTPGQIFKTISSVGKVALEEMEKTFNMGVGMIAVVAPEDRERALAMMTARHVEAWELGTVRVAEEGEPRVLMTGEHPGF
ncbi:MULTISPECIES: phosphoribosylformylglycinamidine cyclo-ligase [Corynebacterium]|uniref:Phosphoribosylformylglycinamidine cyclo-ligase n=2 Tax=Corynebacterium aurimucosum TaxID=169292 RepID=C3PIV1_CORA7|nr:MULTISPECIES: phosphoribosylformylglycinamidine cyclo-ligase [Corynebacterium]ACP33755.1 phosphoribosylformylglycinamidine cyclo-ligase [Corynebacterium aurimucosum ATCC 700975]MBU5655600.1 phosphoribosylformylglycinamidine cyclo-ligase [Corynebacterium aurimucosum]MDK6813395.1 phosphoribosylformylglycinamidine cyclo-ligase [Corynebacterium sp. UMB6689]OFL23393.1 phosphoribosylformylglycinamidine cyclo-ligase [Corynebacterium sp. HMSC062A03]OFP21616.1 phosphoribosylformylglycinamidine cyclo